MQRLVCGLPQGSILSPMLFNVFIDDIVLSLPKSDRHKILLYADDILLFNYGGESLQRLVDRVEEHAHANRYELNLAKCYYMAGEECDISINGHRVERKKSLKYLAFMFNCKGFSTRDTVSHARRGVVVRAVLVRRGVEKVFGRHYNPQLMFIMYKVYVRPAIDYYAGLLGSMKTLMAKMVIMQKKALKYMFRMPMKTPTVLLYGILPVEQIELRSKLLAHGIYRRLKTRAPESTRLFFMKTRTKIARHIREQGEALEHENLVLLKRSTLADQKVGALGTTSLSFNLTRVANPRKWREEVDRVTNPLDYEEMSFSSEHPNAQRFIREMRTIFLPI